MLSKDVGGCCFFCNLGDRERMTVVLVYFGNGGTADVFGDATDIVTLSAV